MASEPTAVIITAKDAAGTIGKAVATALAQRPVVEVVVVDDGSHDGTAAAATGADDGTGRLNIVRLATNRGPSHGRNLGIDTSTAPVVAILDADDFLGAGRVEAMFAKGGQDWDLLADDIQFTTGEDGAQPFDRLLLPETKLPLDLDLSGFALGNIPRKGRPRRELGFLKPLMRRAFLDAHRLRYDPRLRLGEDVLLYTQCLVAGGRFRLVEPCGYFAVQTGHSLSGAHRTQDLGALHAALCDLEATARRGGQPLGGLTKFTASIRNRFHLRRVLDARRERGLSAGLGTMAASPNTIPYVVAEIAAARLSRLTRRP